MNLQAFQLPPVPFFLSHQFPFNEYVLFGSFPLHVQIPNFSRELGDLDVVVSAKLWSALCKRYPITNTKSGIGNRIEIVSPEGKLIELFNQWHMTSYSIDCIFRDAVRIPGYPLIGAVNQILEYKVKQARLHDIADVRVIKDWLSLK